MRIYYSDKYAHIGHSGTIDTADEAFAFADEDGISTVAEIAGYTGLDAKTLRRYINAYPDEYRIRKGGIVCQVTQSD